MGKQAFLSRWRRSPPRATLAIALRAWLTDPGSLTSRIRLRCVTFSVTVLRQCLAGVHRDEAAVLGLRRGELAWVREVLLVADGCPVVFARSVLPRRNVRGAWNLFHGIGSRPLGAALFADPRITREPLACACLDRRDARYHYALRATGAEGQAFDVAVRPAALWARRSMFRLHGRGLLVTEVFLPAILKLPGPR
jgi:chorismate lyase